MVPAVAAGAVLALDLAGAAVLGASVTHGHGPSLAVLLQQAAATVGAFGVIAGAGAWLLGPRVKAYIRSAAGVRRQAVDAAEDAAANSTVAASTAVEVATALADLLDRMQQVESRLDVEAVVMRLLASGALSPEDLNAHLTERTPNQ